MLKRFIPIVVAVWLVALLAAMIFRGNSWANIILLVVSVGLIVLGIFTSRKNKQ